MEDEKTGSRVLNPNPPPSSSSSKEPATNQRLRFTVELRPGETTIVSWKKLLKDSKKAGLRSLPPDPPSRASPVLESRIAPATKTQETDTEVKDAPPANRFSAVIEKIERLYMGEQSSDEELDNVPDDDEYDTEDSFIDDTELDEYFQVDKSPTKHNGFFVNRGKLERTNQPPSSPNHAPKKRRRKDLNSHSEQDGKHFSDKIVKVDKVRMKAAARRPSMVGSKMSGTAQPSKGPLSEHCHEGKSLGNQSNTKFGPSQKRSADFTSTSEHSSQILPNNRDVSTFSTYSMDVKEVKKQKTGDVQRKDIGNKSNIRGDSFSAVNIKPHSKKWLNSSNKMEVLTKAPHRLKNGGGEMPDLNLSGSKYSLNKENSPSMPAKEGSSVRPKGTMLERAIKDLEKIVAETRPPTMDVQEADAASQGVKRRLPQDIKQKVAKVARLAQSSQGKISEELINRLMTILGHLLQLKSLKRHLKEMVELGLSAKQQKADRFKQVKKEVTEMIRARTPFFKSMVIEQQDGSADDFEKSQGYEGKGVIHARYSMDEAIEDKICDLYELYVEGMDEDRGPQSRKLYVELAELWPDGGVDSNGIKSAVNRAKERKRRLYKLHKNAEKIKRKRISPTIKTDATVRGENSSSAQPGAMQESGPAIFVSIDRPISNQIATNHYHSTSNRTPHMGVNPSYLDRPKSKVKGDMKRSRDELNKITDGEVLKKKVKWKPGSEFRDVRGQPTKLTSHYEEKPRQKSHKEAATIYQKQCLSSIGAPGCEQPG